MSKPTLTYFKVNGRCESIRYLLAVGKVNYNNELIDFEQWGAKKPTTLLGSLPEFDTGKGVKISQSLAVARYCAKLGKLYGKNDVEAAQIDMIVDTANEILESVFPIYFKHLDTVDDASKAECKKILENGRAAMLKLSKILGKNQYFVGGQISWADIHFHHCLEVATKGLGQEGLHDNVPENLKPLYERVEKHPAVAKVKKERTYPLVIPRPEKPTKA